MTQDTNEQILSSEIDPSRLFELEANYFNSALDEKKIEATLRLYNHVQEQSKSRFSIVNYCLEKNIDVHAFRNLKSMINFCSVDCPNRYALRMKQLDLFFQQRQSVAGFCSVNNIPQVDFKVALRHRRVLFILSQEKNKGSSNMEFIKVPRGILAEKDLHRDKVPTDTLAEKDLHRDNKRNSKVIIAQELTKMMMFPKDEISPDAIIKLINLIKDL